MKIQAAVLHAPRQPFVIEELDLEAPRAGEVLVKLHACGVCHSDWHLVTGDTKHPMPVVAGHEGAGIVEAVGDGVADVHVGDHVVLSWAPNCGNCFYCGIGKPNLCDTYTGPIWAGTMLDGTTRLSRRVGGKREPVFSYCGTAAFATHTAVPRQSCVVIDKTVPLESACLIGCAVATGVGAAMLTAKVQPGESVVVLGCGGVGLSIIQGARICGARTIIAVDREPSKEALARRLGATDFMLFGGGGVSPPIEFLRQVRGQDAPATNRGTDHVFEAVGLTRLQELALQLARPGGTITFAGLSPMGTNTNLPGSVIARQEKTIKGSYYGSCDPQRDFPVLIELYKNGKLLLDEMITKLYPLEQINDAYRDMADGKLARGIVRL